MKAFSIWLFALILFSSCEKETFVDYYIHNQSSSEIRVDGFDIIHSSAIIDTIQPNVKRDVSGWRKYGKETEYYQPTSMFGSKLTITNAAGDTLKKDFKSLSNWSKHVDDQRGSASHEYVLVVIDADF